MAAQAQPTAQQSVNHYDYQAYDTTISQIPRFDQNSYNPAEKIMCVWAMVPKNTPKTAIHLKTEDKQTPNNWNREIDEHYRDGWSSIDQFTIMHKVHIPTDQINAQIQFKLTFADAPESSKNWAVDLKNYGEITAVYLGSVTFN